MRDGGNRDWWLRDWGWKGGLGYRVRMEQWMGWLGWQMGKGVEVLG